MFKSAVSTVSKSFSDLLKLWQNRETLNDHHEDKAPTSVTSPPNHRHTLSPPAAEIGTEVDVNLKETLKGWKSAAGLMDVDDNISFKSTTAPGPPTETTSLCFDGRSSAFRGSNRNIRYLVQNIHTVSKEAVDLSDNKHDNDLCKDGEASAECRSSDRQSVVSESRMFKKSPTHKSQTAHGRRLYNKRNSSEGDERVSLRRKHIKANSESGNELALIKQPNSLHVSARPKTKETENNGSYSALDKSRALSVSQQSLTLDDIDDQVFHRSERSLSLPPVPQNPTYINIKNSSEVYVGLTAATADMSEKRLSFSSNPSVNPKSVSSGDSISGIVRKDVAEPCPLISKEDKELTQTILEEHENSQASVVTKRLEAARECLRQNPFLILTGYDGEGLTTLGYDLLLDYPNREKFIVMEKKEMLPCMTQADDKQVIVFADDVFGTTYFDEKRYENLYRNMSRLQKLIKRNKAILIIAIHLKFMKVPQCMAFCDYYQDNILNISSKSLELDIEDKRKILRCNIISQRELLRLEICKSKAEETTCTSKNVLDTGVRYTKVSEQTIEDIARLSLSSGFPGKVAHFLKNIDNIKRGVKFFISPPLEMFEEIDSYRTSKTKEDFETYLALVAAYVYGSLNFDTFEIHCQYLAKSEKALRKYLESCTGKSQRIGQKTKCPDMINVLTGFAKKFKLMPSLAGSVKRGVMRMLGRYIKEHMKRDYTLASSSVERVVAVSCAREYPKDICKYSSKSIFSSIVGPDTAFEERELHVNIKENDNDVCHAVIERLKLLLSSNKLSVFIGHPAMRVAWFAKRFWKHLKKDNDFVSMILQYDDKTEISLISLSLNYPYIAPGSWNTQCFAEDLMLSKKWTAVQKEDLVFAKEREKELLEKCCKMGWTRSYFRLIEKRQLCPSKDCLLQSVNSRNIDILEDVSGNMCLTQDDWYGALQQACELLEEGDLKTLEVIRYIQQKVPFEYQSEAVESIIHRAGRNGDDILLSKVISLYKKKNLRNLKGLTCLHLSAQGNHYHCVQLALEHGVSQRIPDRNGEFPLHYACKLGFTDIVTLLVEDDTEVVNCVSRSKSSPLHISAEKGNLDITKLLVTNGATLNVIDSKGRSPVYYAARYGTGVVLRYLLENELNDTCEDKQLAVEDKTGNETDMSLHARKLRLFKREKEIFEKCLIDIMLENSPESLKMDSITHLIQMGANPNYSREDSLPLLQLAIEYSYSVEFIEFLISNGASVLQKDLRTSDNALHKAVKKESKHIVELILKSARNTEDLLKQRNKENETPLHIAVDKGLVSIVRMLKTESTIKDFVVVNRRCLTPLALAVERQRQSTGPERRRYEEVIKVLSQSL